MSLEPLAALMVGPGRRAAGSRPPRGQNATKGAERRGGHGSHADGRQRTRGDAAPRNAGVKTRPCPNLRVHMLVQHPRRRHGHGTAATADGTDRSACGARRCAERSRPASGGRAGRDGLALGALALAEGRAGCGGARGEQGLLGDAASDRDGPQPGRREGARRRTRPRCCAARAGRATRTGGRGARGACERRRASVASVSASPLWPLPPPPLRSRPSPSRLGLERAHTTATTQHPTPTEWCATPRHAPGHARFAGSARLGVARRGRGRRPRWAERRRLASADRRGPRPNLNDGDGPQGVSRRVASCVSERSRAPVKPNRGIAEGQARLGLGAPRRPRGGRGGPRPGQLGGRRPRREGLWHAGLAGLGRESAGRSRAAALPERGSRGSTARSSPRFPLSFPSTPFHSIPFPRQRRPGMRSPAPAKPRPAGPGEPGRRRPASPGLRRRGGRGTALLNAHA